MGNPEEGTIKIKSGNFEVEGDNIVKGTFEIDMNSIESTSLTGDMKDKLENHLKSADFFATESYPVATFNFKSVKDGVVEGELTLKEATHPVTFSADIKMADGKVTAKGSFELDRTMWNVRFGSGKFFQNLGDNLIKDAMKIELDLVANAE